MIMDINKIQIVTWSGLSGLFPQGSVCLGILEANYWDITKYYRTVIQGL